MLNKTAKEWGLPLRQTYYDVDCWSCGHLLYSGKEKCHGIQETAKPYTHETVEEWQKFSRFQELCSVCLQVQLGINKDSLHQEDSPNCGRPIKRIFLCNRDMTRIAVWEVLNREPWLKQVQKLPEKEKVQPT